MGLRGWLSSLWAGLGAPNSESGLIVRFGPEAVERLKSLAIMEGVENPTSQDLKAVVNHGLQLYEVILDADAKGHTPKIMANIGTPEQTMVPMISEVTEVRERRKVVCITDKRSAQEFEPD